MKHSHPQTGFTLIEILVALFIIAFALVALLAAEFQASRTSVGLRERTLANWVANNRLTELRLASEWPSIGSGSESVELANRRWRVEVDVSETTDPDLRRIDISVAHENEPNDTVTRLTGFRGKPQAPLLPQPAQGDPQ